MPPDPSNANPPTGRRIVRCDQCGRSRDVAYADLLRYTKVGWPMCCGGVMGYYVEAKRPSARDDTDLDRPALPPGV
jgi:hypothetical protein